MYVYFQSILHFVRRSSEIAAELSCSRSSSSLPGSFDSDISHSASSSSLPNLSGSRFDSYQISVHSGKWFQRRRFFRNQPIRNKNGLWRPCLLMDRDEMSNLYRGPSIDASYQVSVHLAKRFQRRFV